jgi:hypothetical protein
VWFDPQLRVKYQPRGSWRTLARQYFEYGQWKREMLRRHPRSLRWRQAVPPVALVANVTGVVLGLTVDRRFLAVPGAYALAAVAAGVTAGRAQEPGTVARLPAVFATMHHAWALGFVLGPRSAGRR